MAVCDCNAYDAMYTVSLFPCWLVVRVVQLVLHCSLVPFVSLSASCLRLLPNGPNPAACARFETWYGSCQERVKKPPPSTCQPTGPRSSPFPLQRQQTTRAKQRKATRRWSLRRSVDRGFSLPQGLLARCFSPDQRRLSFGCRRRLSLSRWLGGFQGVL